VIFEIPDCARAEPSIISSEAGRQIDFNDEQPHRTFASIRVNFEPGSNANDESEVHEENEHSPRNSTEAGRQIDSNDEHLENAFASIRVSFEQDSNVNEQSESYEQKHPRRRISISRGKITVESEPKYRITDVPAESTRKLPETLKYRFPGSTLTLEIPDCARAEPSIISSEAGRQIDFNDEQSESALASIRASFEPDSNVNDESREHDQNEHSPINSTEAGRQIDSNEIHSESALASIRVNFEQDWNANDERALHAERDLSPRDSTEAGR
jgi:hypothetical protein